MRPLAAVSLLVVCVSLPCQAQPVVERAPAASAYRGAAECTEAESDRGATLTRAVTGTVVESVRVQFVRCSDNGYSYRFETSRQQGEGSVSLFTTPNVVLADLNFDGYADLWVTGYPDGQGRIRTSDVWLYRPDRSVFVLDSAYSSLPNLSVSAASGVLEAGIGNMGCSAACWYSDRYVVGEVGLVPVSRVEQDRVGDEYVYREYEWTDDVRVQTYEARAETPGEIVYPEAEPIEFIDIARYAYR